MLVLINLCAATKLHHSGLGSFQIRQLVQFLQVKVM